MVSRSAGTDSRAVPGYVSSISGPLPDGRGSFTQNEPQRTTGRIHRAFHDLLQPAVEVAALPDEEVSGFWAGAGGAGAAGLAPSVVWIPAFCSNPVKSNPSASAFCSRSNNTVGTVPA